MIRAVVFDFDGVLANSEPLHFSAFRDVLAPRGLRLTEQDYYDKYLGYDDLGAFRTIAIDAGRPLAEREISAMAAQKAVRLEELERGTSVLFPGAREAIARMAAHGPIAIASGAIRAEILRVLDREGLTSCFPVIVAAEDTAVSKPHPAPYLRAVELLTSATQDLAARGCVAIEDSVWGLRSARAAGLRTVGVTHSYPAEALAEADAVIDRLDQLTPSLLASLG
jgi:beta-phosphoglucomutase